MYQSITIVGNLGRDPVSKQTQSGKSYANFSVAVSRNLGQGQRETVWFSVTAWEKAGEYMCNYAQKGSLVMVAGRLACDPQSCGPRIWVDQQGNARAGFEIIASTVQILSGFKTEEERNATPQMYVQARSGTGNREPRQGSLMNEEYY